MPTELRYERWFLPLSAPLGLGPGQSEVRIEDGNLRVAMGWGFRATIPVRAHVMGVPITLRTLWVSVTDPDALIAAVAPAS